MRKQRQGTRVLYLLLKLARFTKHWNQLLKLRLWDQWRRERAMILRPGRSLSIMLMVWRCIVFVDFLPWHNNRPSRSSAFGRGRWGNAVSMFPESSAKRSDVRNAHTLKAVVLKQALNGTRIPRSKRIKIHIDEHGVYVTGWVRPNAIWLVWFE